MTPTPPTNPGVRMPPPVLFVAGFVAGALAQRVWPLGLAAIDRRATVAVGGALVVAGLGVALSGFLTFSRHHTAIRPDRPASALVTSGPYRWTRNPMYVGLTTAYVGLALVVGTAWPIIVLPVVLVALTRLVIRREEAYLAGVFGPRYDEYRGRVRRWI